MGTKSVQLGEARSLPELDGLKGLADWLGQFVERPDLDEAQLMMLWQRFGELQTDIGALRQMVVVRMAATLEPWVWHAVEGQTPFRLKPKKPKARWDDRQLMRAYLERARQEGRVNHVDDVAEVLLEALQVAYWRVGAVEAAGFKPDDYRERPEPYPGQYEVETR
jgi:hypothetical protein